MTPSLATANSSTTIQSSGTILYPSPSPTPSPSPSPSPINYASIDKWAPYTYEPYSYPSPQITFLDTNVLFNGQPTIRIDKHHDGVDPNIYNELDLPMIHGIKAGDHILMKIWMKTDNLPNYVYNPNDWTTWGGARMVVDYYDDQGPIWSVANSNGAIPQSDESVRDNYVVWNTPSWTQRTIELIVPQSMLACYPPQTVRTPTAIVLTIQRLNPNNNPIAEGSVWFGGPELYINP